MKKMFLILSLFLLSHISFATYQGAPVKTLNGGTQVTTTTAYGIITGGTTATGALQNAGTGTSGQVYISNGASSLGTWGAVNPFTTSTITTSTNVVSGTTYLVNTSAAVTLTLPAASANAFFYVKDITGSIGTNNITIARHASESIEGFAANLVLQAVFGHWLFVCDGTNWWIIG